MARDVEWCGRSRRSLIGDKSPFHSLTGSSRPQRGSGPETGLGENGDQCQVCQDMFPQASSQQDLS